MIHKYIIEATDEIKGFEEAIERLDREWGIEELEPCEDAISRQAVLDYAKDTCLDLDSFEDTEIFCDEIKLLPSVTPLPKGHGRLIDADELFWDIQTDEQMRLGVHIAWVKERIDNAQTIIEAESEDRNDSNTDNRVK